MDLIKNKTRFAGVLFLAAMLAGILSVAPAVDGPAYLTEAAAHPGQVLLATIAQFMMSLTYLGVGLLLYPVIKRFGARLSLGFLNLRIIAAGLVILGCLLLPVILSVSQAFVKDPSNPALGVTGALLRATRDYINHVFMILVLCSGNILFYLLLFRAKLIPRWLSVWGMSGALLSILASLLVLFRVLDIIAAPYLLLNVPTALQELFLGIWLIAKGFNKKIVAAGDEPGTKG